MPNTILREEERTWTRGCSEAPRLPSRRPPRGRSVLRSTTSEERIDEIEEDQDRCRTRRRLHYGDRSGRLGSERTPGPAAGPVGRVPHPPRRRLRQGHRQEGDRHADQARRDRHADPRRRLHDHRQDREAYFECVNDNGGINGHPIKYTLYNEQLNPAQQAALAKKLIESDKVVGIVGNTSFTECGDELEVLQVQGLRRDRRRRPGGVLRHAVFAEVNMGPRYSNIGAAQALDQGGREVDRRSPRRHDLGVCRRRRASGRQGGRASRCKYSRRSCRSRMRTRRPPAGPGGRRPGGGVILDFTPDTATGVHEGGDRAGPRRQGDVGLVDADREHVHGRQFAGVRRTIVDQLGVQQPSTRVGPDSRCIIQITDEVRTEDRPQAFGQMGFMVGKFATQLCSTSRAPITAKSYNAAVRTEEPEDGHALQAVVRRASLAVPHPEQLGHHGRLQERQGRRRRRSASRSRRSTRRSPRPASGRRSSTCSG